MSDTTGAELPTTATDIAWNVANGVVRASDVVERHLAASVIVMTSKSIPKSFCFRKSSVFMSSIFGRAKLLLSRQSAARWLGGSLALPAQSVRRLPQHNLLQRRENQFQVLPQRHALCVANIHPHPFVERHL